VSAHQTPLRTYVVLVAGLAMFAFAPIFVRGAGADADPVAITTIRTVSAFLMLVPFWLFARYREMQVQRRGLSEGRGAKAASPAVAATSALSSSNAKHTDTAASTTDAQDDSSVNKVPSAAERTPIAALVWTRKEVAWSALAGLFLAAHLMLWIGSLFFTSVASASVLVTIHPIMLIVVESLFLKKRFPVASWIGVLVAFSGSVMLGISDAAPNESFANPMLGNLMAFTAAFLFVFYILISQKIRKNSGWLDYVFAVYGFTALFSVVIAGFLGVHWLMQPMATVVVGVALAVGASIIGHGSMNYAVKFISATLLSTLILAEPVFATILAYFIFAEMPAVTSIIAMGIIMGGVFATWWARRRAVGNG
jgi:drug/metabolite transporter (DMT)-like permease